MSDPSQQPGTAAYSPMLTGYADVYAAGLAAEVSSHQESPQASTSPVPVPVVPRPPNPSIGGKVGRSRAFGWTTGLRPSRSFRQRFTGRTLVVPNQGPHPVTGPVGFSNRTGRLAAGVDALYGSPTPDPQTVAQMIVTMGRNANPLLYEMGRGDENV